MSIKKEAAYHESAHVVLAHRARFHKHVGNVVLMDYGQGVLEVSLSREKLEANGKPATAQAAQDEEVVAELAEILCAGLVAEEIASELDPSLTPTPSCAIPDHELARSSLIAAGMSAELDIHREAARRILSDDWEKVEALADYLYQKGWATPQEMQSIIESR